MSVLHVLASPEAAESCLAAAAPGDAVLLVGDGVFAHDVAEHAGIRFGLLRDDAISRGLDLPTGVQALGYGEFVDWVVASGKTVTWR